MSFPVVSSGAAGPSSDNLFVPVGESAVLPVPSYSEIPRVRPEPIFFDAVPPKIVVDSPIRQERVLRNDVPVFRQYDCSDERVLKPLSLGFSYDGKTCVIEFLERLEENRLARNISDARLLKSACELFKDVALDWYRTIASQLTTWPQLVKVLRETFGSPTYDRDVLKLVRSRIQRPEEPLHIFVTVVLGHLHKLTRPLSETEQLAIILPNLKPFLQQSFALVPVHSLSELLRVGKQLEHAQLSIVDYNSTLQTLTKNRPSSSKVYTVDHSCNNSGVPEVVEQFKHCEVSEVDYHSSGSRGFRGGFNRGGFSRGKTTDVGGPRGGHSNPRGARGGTHHGFSKYCYRCGKFNFTITTCPDCSKVVKPSQSSPAVAKNVKPETE